MNKITFTENAWEEYLAWQVTDRKTLKKLNALLRKITRTPYEGTGKPEPLRGELARLWSRRINQKDRLVYYAEEDRIVVYQCKGHYEDK